MRGWISAGSGRCHPPMRWRVWPTSSRPRRRGPAQGVVARIDWARFLPLYQQAGGGHSWRSWSARCPPAAGAVPSVTPSGTTPLVERLTQRSVQQRKKLLTDYLRDTVAEVTRVDAAEIREDAGFFDLGMDSLMAVELRRHIEQGVGKEIPVTLAMDHPRLSDVADYLLGEVLGLSEQAGRARADRRPVTTTRTDEPIAIVAVSCRFPGAPNPEAFWEVLSGGVDAIREVPEDRFDIDEFYDPDPETPGQDLHALRRIPRRHRRIRSRVLRHLPARGRVDRAAAAADARNRVGGPGTRRVLAGSAARQPHRRLRRAWPPTSTRTCCRRSRSTRSSPTSSPAMRSTPSPVGSPSRSDSKARRWRSTPHAARRWWPSIRPARRCAPVTAIWRWPAG